MGAQIEWVQLMMSIEKERTNTLWYCTAVSGFCIRFVIYANQVEVGRVW